MAMIGKMIDIPCEHNFEWRIEDFSTLSDNKYYESPVFYCANVSWYIRIKHNKSIGCIYVSLMRKSSGFPISLDFSLILKTMDEKTDRKVYYSHVFEEPDKGWGYATLSENFKCLKNRSELGLPDVLTIICTMKCLECADCATSGKLSGDLKALMLSGDLSDTLIKVKGEEFPLHRTILAARNSYFYSMFTNDMKEKNTGMVSIDDCKPDTFRTFIQFIYTGKVDKLLPETVCELYEMADKYLEDQLKKICLDFMMKTLSEDSFCDLIIFALKYDEKQLFEKAAELFTSKPNKIISSVKWQSFVEKYPIQVNELFVKVVNHHVK